MNIREAAACDLDSMVLLLEQLGYPANAAQLGSRLQVLRQHGAGEAFVALASGRVAGLAVVHIMAPLHVDSAWALLSALVVDRDCRSAGVGAHLLQAAEDFVSRRGCSQIELSSNEVRTRAHAFYERNGYREKRLRFVKTLPSTSTVP